MDHFLSNDAQSAGVFCAFAEKFNAPHGGLLVMPEHAPEPAQSWRIWARSYAKPMTSEELTAKCGKLLTKELVDRTQMVRDIQSHGADLAAIATVLLSCYRSVVTPPLPLFYPVPIDITTPYLRAPKPVDA